MVTLAFIPINMLGSPVFDYISIEETMASWTVTVSAFIFLVVLSPLLLIPILFLKSRSEKIFKWSLAGFLTYAFIFTFSISGDLVYPIYGLVSLSVSALVGLLFYVAIRDEIISREVIFNSLAFTSILVVVPLCLVQFDVVRFARLATETGAASILYGYENPRALGWASTFFLSLLTASLVTRPKDSGAHPIFLLLIIACSVTLFWSGSRGGLVVFAASIAFVFFLSKTKNYQSASLVMICIVLAAIVAHLLYLPSASYGIFDRISQNLNQDNLEAISSGRIRLWSLTFSYITERPLSGYGYLPHKELQGFTHGSAHNIVLDVWLWFGVIIGTILVLLGFWMWGKLFVFFLSTDDHYISALFCVVTVLCAYSILSGPYARTFPLFLFAISCGVLAGLRASKANSY